MRKAIVYASVHHGNTEKIVNSIAEECRIDIENRTTIYKSVGSILKIEQQSTKKKMKRIIFIYCNKLI